jgi:acyl-CoA oxidase
VLKCKSTWLSGKIITECREMMGGHGYSKHSSLHRLYHDNDVNATWEGDNHILLQQTSKFLLKFIPKKQIGKVIDLGFLH